MTADVVPFHGKRRRLSVREAMVAWIEALERFRDSGGGKQWGELALVAYWDFLNASYPNNPDFASQLFAAYAVELRKDYAA